MIGWHEWVVVLGMTNVRSFLTNELEMLQEIKEADIVLENEIDSKHLERYQSWKLDSNKMKSLIQAESKGMEALERVKEDENMQVEFYASGKRGMLFVNQEKTKLIKVQKFNDHGVQVIEKECKWLEIVNRMDIGPRLLKSGNGYLMCEFLVGGLDAIAFLKHPNVTRSHVVWFLKNILYQCFTLDVFGINKAEMTHPMRHIIVHNGRVVFVDFEKCTYGQQRRNVTQICQFLASPRVVAAVTAKGHSMAIDKLRLATKQYKMKPNSKTFDTILQTLRLNN
ncbi:hypothetical protein THRCLA_02925 [Thraustotheca clavata]|uniref:Protein kinase domain-containing protein n=1 Tax=Thraustotheca clavata TaxID=74557 RepID=A0A1W0A3L3_9STRA|nr:hypothetical protein THRCLA_02925 [Thraustotheca clavata]